MALGLAAVLFVRVNRLPDGNDAMRDIAAAIREGSMTFLWREYKILAVYCLVVSALITYAIGPVCAGAFVLGAFLSLLAGNIGMRAATRGNVRTAEAAHKSTRGHALMVAFDGGAVMGLSVAGLSILGLGGLYYFFYGTDLITQVIHGFGVGASSIALFARIGGGIYTKAADVGADLVGKLEAGIPEDDPRNPGVIADNVGDNVGDVAGMGADIFESFVAACVATIAIALTADPSALSKLMAVGADSSPDHLRLMGSLLPLAAGGIGLITSMVAIIMIRLFKDMAPAVVLRISLLFPPVVFIAASAIYVNAMAMNTAIVGVLALGSVGGAIIGLITDYYTSSRPIRAIAESAKTGAATAVIKGLAVGLESAIAPLLILAAITWGSWLWLDLYGIALSAVAMLAMTAMVMTVDAYGPIADNAGGIAEMSHLPPHVRKITDELDAVGNTTAAIGKGFAIGSAVLTVIALFAAFKFEVDFHRIARGGEAMALSLVDARVLAGLLIGSMLPCVVGASTMTAVGNAAQKIVEEIRRQFREIPGLLEGKPGVKPDTAACVDLATRAALAEMILPGVVAVLAPVVIGFALGAEALAGALAGALCVGAVLSLFMANAGGAWDNAKKAIEKGAIPGQMKGSDAHKAAVIGDTVGDPFKDTSGPGIAILIKVMSVVSLMIASLLH